MIESLESMCNDRRQVTVVIIQLILKFILTI